MSAFNIVWDILQQRRFEPENYSPYNPTKSQDPQLRYIKFKMPLAMTESSSIDLPENIEVFFKFSGGVTEFGLFQTKNENFSNIPRIIKKQIVKDTNFYIKVLGDDIFSFEAISSISLDKSAIVFNELLSNLISELSEFILEVLREYQVYLNDTHEWIKNKAPEKINSLFLKWGIQKHCKVIEVDDQEFIKLTKQTPSEDFRPFKVLVMKSDQIFFEIRLIIPFDEKMKYFTYFVNCLHPVKDLLLTFDNWISQNTFSSDEKIFVRETEEKDLIDYFL